MIILYILAPIACLFMLLNFIGLFFPRYSYVEKSILLNADQNTIFKEVVSLPNFITWDPWSKRDPHIQQTFNGTEGEVGSSYHWKGNNKVREGSMKILKITPNEYVEQDLVFGKGNPSKAMFKLKPANGGIELTWCTEMNMGKMPFSRIIGELVKKMIAKDFEQGLQNLKNKLSA